MTRIVVAGLGALTFFVGFFLIAGWMHWTRGWATLGLICLGQTISALYVSREDPELLKRRLHGGEGTKWWDRLWLGAFGVFCLMIFVVAGVDVGKGGSTVPAWLWPLGAVLYLAFAIGITWAMHVNTHFEKTIRIQTDRNHKVIDDGPYRYVRHPGYLVLIGGLLLPLPILLGSWWALVPAAVSSLWVVLRTVLEDWTLRRELDGYAEYAERVRHRLIPKVW
jgi:protein-S-isoprenylcysteine O-methyltransferase Ste14